MRLRIQKRDGSLQKFDKKKIHKALMSAFHEAGENVNMAHTATNMVVDRIKDSPKIDAGIINIEVIQDLVEEVLMASYPVVAKEYITYRQQRAQDRKQRLKPDPDALANYIHFSKYSRFDNDKGRRETYEETVDRVLNMHLQKYPNCRAEIINSFELVFQKRVLPSMRSMQFAGKAIEVANARMYNCSFTLIDRSSVFGDILYLLLCGCGVGFSVQWPHVEKLHKLARIGRKVKHVTIPDSCEGWAQALHELLISFIMGYHVEFNYSQIRDEGKLLVTSGGLAPGHLPLKIALENIRGVLLKAQGRKLRPIECHDIVCYSAEAVLAGGIRRSSLISLFSAQDTEMLYAKSTGNYDPMRGLNSQRAMANNSAVLFRGTQNQDLFRRIVRIAEEGFGDPGFFFTNNVDYGCNPCGEIGLHPVYEGNTGFSFCNLCEINVAAAKNRKELLRAATAAAVIGTLQAGYTDFPFLGSVTEEIVRRDALLGVGMTGMMDNPDIAFDPNLQREAAKEVLRTNAIVARKIGINPCSRATTIKPGGTAPLELGGVGCGIHPHHARRYFRRVTANPIEPALLHFMRYNPHMVEEKPNGDRAIVFPVEAPTVAKTVKEMSALEFMELIFLTYDNWVMTGNESDEDLTHNVSATVTLGPEEQEAVVELILKNQHRIAAMSFAPRLLDKKFPFAPREEVTPADESRWNYLIENYRKVDWTTISEKGMEILNPGVECSGAKCDL